MILWTLKVEVGTGLSGCSSALYGEVIDQFLPPLLFRRLYRGRVSSVLTRYLWRRQGAAAGYARAVYIGRYWKVAKCSLTGNTGHDQMTLNRLVPIQCPELTFGAEML